MGRIRKKKDANVKKAQRASRLKDGSALQTGTTGAVSKSVPVLKKTAGTAKPKAAGLERNFIQKSIQFLREVKIELKKVTWPTRKQAMGSTAVVIVLVMIISLFLGLVDFSLSSLIRVVLP